MDEKSAVGFQSNDFFGDRVFEEKAGARGIPMASEGGITSFKINLHSFSILHFFAFSPYPYPHILVGHKFLLPFQIYEKIDARFILSQSRPIPSHTLHLA